jgi:hypothetical protein
MVRKIEQLDDNDEKTLSFKTVSTKAIRKNINKIPKIQQKDFYKCVSVYDSINQEEKDEIKEKSLLEKIDLPELKEEIPMSLLSKKEPENKLSDTDLETIKSVFDDTFNTFDNGNEDKMKDIETVKIIIKELLAVDKHLPSTTKLNSVQVTELAQAKYLNSFFKSPIIDLYMNQFMKLKRSETKEITSNLLDGLLSIGNTSMHSNNQFDESKGILGSRWKR